MREIGVEELFATSADPFVRHHVDPAGTRRAWVYGAAAVVDGAGGRPGGVASGVVFSCLGPPADLAPLMAEVASVVEPPLRLTVETTSYDAVPEGWRHSRHHRWHWMLTGSTPPVPAYPLAEVDGAEGAAEINAVLDAANPDSFARPGTPGVECWLGVRDAEALIAVGALIRQPRGAGHLRGVSVLPTHTGLGFGRAVSAGLTLRGLSTGSGVVTLGVFVDNAPAVAIYERLGYVVSHTFASGPLSG